jgi:hypothetical protein
MTQSCWWDLGNIFQKRQQNRTSSPSEEYMGEGAMNRRRSKSTSSEGVGVDPTQSYRRSHTSRHSHLSGIYDADIDIDSRTTQNSQHDPDNNNVHSAFGAGQRELLIGERIRTRTISGSGSGGGRNKNRAEERDGRIVELVHVLLLTCVFVLGALSAVFVIVCYKHGEFGFGPMREKTRTELFQPFPQADLLAVIDEHYLDPVTLPFDTGEDDECDGENKLG